MALGLVRRIAAETTGAVAVRGEGSADVVAEVVSGSAVGTVQVCGHLCLDTVGVESALLDT